MRENKRNSREDNSSTGNKKGKSDSRDTKPRNDKKPFESKEKLAYSNTDRKPYKSAGSKDDKKPYEGKERRGPKPEYSSSDRKPYKSADSRDERPRGDKKPYENKDRRGPKPEYSSSDRKPFKTDGPRGEKRSFGSDDKKPHVNRRVGDKPERSFKPEGDRPERSSSFSRDKPGTGAERKGRSYIKKDDAAKSGDKRTTGKSSDIRPFRKREEDNYKNKTTFGRERKPVTTERKSNVIDDGKIRLNRYIANSGICSRRKADELIEAGVISVNGDVVAELGFKVDPAKDVVRYNGELLKREKRVYVLLNKPKDYITTTDDPQERRTVMQLVEKASRERIYPVGRLDRNTTGLLLMTNDGDLADKLSHPKNGITKIYQVELSRNLSQGDLNKIEFGLELEDGLIKPDSISYVAGGSKKEIGIQIHSGKNRIVRRIFEHLGYDVVKLDRVVYGNLTKKDLPRGRWRYLEDHELIQIKHLIK